MPRLGTRKLYYLIKDELAASQIKFGRDKLFNLLRQAGLLIRPQRRYIQTTMSKHWMRKWPNLVKGITIDAPNQVWVSDITYIKTQQGTCYLNMITDAYSRRIMGYAVDETMDTESMIKALEMAQAERSDTATKTIHHSDRGLQYCSREYVELSRKNNIQLSMTEHSDPYENALAERMNRTIKEEFGLNRKLKSRQQVYDLVKESIHLYNQIRPHLALEMRTPNEVYKQKIPTTWGNRDN